MKSQDGDTATGTSEETEPEQQATEQTESESKPVSYAEQLLKEAVEDGYEVGAPQPKAETETEVESEKTEPEEKESETETKPETEEKPEETKEEESEKELKPAAEKKGDEWPDSAKQRVAEETAKRKRANERAEVAEQRVREYEQQLAKVTAPVPTEDNPFIDIQDVNALDRLERSYEKTIDLADENPEGAEDILVGRKPDGSEIRRDFTVEELSMLKRKAEKAIRKQIPERRTYLQQRAANDAQALEVYPELKNPESEFTKTAAQIAQSILTGKAQKDPTLLIWIGHAIKGYQASLQRNGQEKTPEVKTPEAKKILNSARQKIAPTPVRTRSITERRSSSALEKAKKKLEEQGDEDSAEELIGLLLSRNKGHSKQLEPLPE